MNVGQIKLTTQFQMLDPNPSTREDDLVNGPLLLSIGDGISIRDHEHETAHSSVMAGQEIVLDDVPTGTHNEPMFSPRLPLISSTTSRSTITHSEISSGGELLSITSLSKGSQSDHQRNLPFIPRQYEFAWENSTLTFAGEPFGPGPYGASLSRGDSDVPVASRSPSGSLIKPTIRSLGHEKSQHLFMGLWSPNLDDLKQLPATLDLNQELRKACSTTTDTSSLCTSIFAEESDYDIDAEDFPIFVHATINELIERRFYHYLRSHAPPNPRDRRTKSSHSSGQSTHGQTTKDPGGTNAPKRHRKRQLGRITGDDQGSEDENRDVHHDTQPSNFQSRRTIACPFLRRDPSLYQGTCFKILTKISHLKNHLRVKHYNEYCEKCFLKFSKTFSSEHLLCSPQQEPRGFFTKAKLAEINKHAGRKRFEEQWKHLYKVLFPGEKVNFEPYLSDRLSEAMKGLEYYIRSKEGQAELREDLESEGCFEYLDEICRAVTMRFMPRVLQRSPLPPTFSGKVYSTKTKGMIQSDYGHSDSAVQHHDIIPDMINTSKLQGMDISTAMQQLDSPAGAYMHLDLQRGERIECLPLSLEEQQAMGVLTDWPIQGASGAGNNAIAELDFDNWAQPGDYFQPLKDFELLHTEE